MKPRPPVTIVVRGPGHHDRALAAARLVGELAPALAVAVQMGLRPRLASDIEVLLDAGAGGVILDGSRSSGVFRAHPAAAPARRDALAGVDVVVELVPGEGPVRAAVRAEPGTDPGPDATVAAAAGAIDRVGLGPDPTAT